MSPDAEQKTEEFQYSRFTERALKLRQAHAFSISFVRPWFSLRVLRVDEVTFW